MRDVNIDEIDEILSWFDEGYAVDYDEAYIRFNQVRVLPPNDLPSDPFSPEYRDRYLQIYKKISTRGAYSVENEKSYFNIDEMTYRPFPYYTKSLKLASLHYSLMGKLFEVLDVKAGSDILEFGFGWGHTTLSLAMLGHNVTAVDIGNDYCELVRRRAELMKVDSLEILNADFLWAETTDKKFDAIIFFECFHHCWEFERLLIALARIIKPGGKIYFGSEPINREFTVPWGTRLDGESLFVARRFGWMELGFHSDFFEALLRRTGWLGRCVQPQFWVASLLDEPIVFDPADVRILSDIGDKTDGKLRISAPGPAARRSYATYGPRIALPRGKYRVELVTSLINVVDSHDVIFDVVHAAGSQVLFGHHCTADEVDANTYTCEFELGEPIDDLEVRLMVPGGVTGTIDGLMIRALP